MSENTDANANFLNLDWWKTATIEDVKAEIDKGIDVDAMDSQVLDYAIKKVHSFVKVKLKEFNVQLKNVTHTIEEQTKIIYGLDKEIENLNEELDSVKNDKANIQAGLDAYKKTVRDYSNVMATFGD